MTRFRAAATAILAVVLLSACSAYDPASAPSPTSTPSATHTTAATPTPSATSTPTPTPTPPHPVSLPALMQQEYDGGNLRLGDVLETAGTYTRYAVSYRSAGLTISGILNLPDGDGPFPVLVLAHGYIDPEIYTTGRGLRREQDYLARQGYAVLHTDYRNHAGSDDDPANEVRLRLGYTEDVVNAVLAIKAATHVPQLDGERVGLLGRSMGGGVTLNALVVRPGLVDAAVIYASVSSNAVQNFDTWTRGQPEAADLTAQVIDSYGAPETNQAFWRDVSPATFVSRVTEPVLIHHGTADDTCPLQWAYDTDAALRTAGKDVTLQVYEGEPHAFEGDWQLSIERSAAFFAEHLAAG